MSMRVIPDNMSRRVRGFVAKVDEKLASRSYRYNFYKKYYAHTSGMLNRPPPSPFGATKPGIQHPRVPSYAYLNSIEKSVPILRACTLIIKKEVFRNKGDWQPNFLAKCTRCKTEFMDTPEVCPECNNEKFSAPNYAQKDAFEPFIKKANLNEQRLLDVLKELEEDLNIGDDAYLVVPKKVVAEVNDTPLFAPVEIFRGDPDLFRKVTDEFGLMGGKYWKCMECGEVQESTREQASNLVCKCGNNLLYDVHYVALNKTGRPSNYYIKGEVCHRSKFSPTLLYGYSPILTLHTQVTTLSQMDDRVQTRFEKGRTEGILTIPSRNPKALKIFKDEMVEDQRVDPNNIPVLASDPDARHMPQFVQMLGTLGDNQFIELQDKIIQKINAIYGVSLVFQADTSTSGGLNNEGLQIAITNRSVEDAQENYNDGFLPFLMEQFYITDWTWKLNPSAEEDRVAEVDLQTKRINNAKEMLGIGYVPYLQNSGEFEYERDVEEAQRITGKDKEEAFFNPLSMSANADEEVQKSLDKAFIDPRKTLLLEAIKEGFWGSFKGMSDSQVDKVFNTMLDTMTQPQGWSVNSIVRQLDKILPEEFERGPLERIVRTETTSIVNLSRSMEYEERDPKGEFKYRWIGPSDGRTTKICEEIQRRTKEGVSMKELDRIIEEVSKKYGAEPRPKLPHINCRHTFRRVIPEV